MDGIRITDLSSQVLDAMKMRNLKAKSIKEFEHLDSGESSHIFWSMGGQPIPRKLCGHLFCKNERGWKMANCLRINGMTYAVLQYISSRWLSMALFKTRPCPNGKQRIIVCFGQYPRMSLRLKTWKL